MCFCHSLLQPQLKRKKLGRIKENLQHVLGMSSSRVFKLESSKLEGVTAEDMRQGKQMKYS